MADWLVFVFLSVSCRVLLAARGPGDMAWEWVMVGWLAMAADVGAVALLLIHLFGVSWNGKAASTN